MGSFPLQKNILFCAWIYSNCFTDNIFWAICLNAIERYTVYHSKDDSSIHSIAQYFCGHLRCFMFFMLSLHSFKNIETCMRWWNEHRATDQGLSHLSCVLFGISLHWEWVRSSRTWSHPPVNLCASDAVDTASFRWAGATAATSCDCQPGEDLHCCWSQTSPQLCWLGLQYFSTRTLCILGDFSSLSFSIWE